MAIDFPSSPAEGDVLHISPGRSMVFLAGTWGPSWVKTALPKNYIVNPCMSVSQENGDTLSANAASNAGYYGADQWQGRWSISPGMMQCTRYSNAGSIYLRVNTAKAAPLAAGDYAIITQRLEGNRMADFQWGSAAGRPAVLRFLATINGAGRPLGPYSIRIGCGTRSYLTSFTFSALGAWQEFIVPIPPSTSSPPSTDASAWGAVEFIIASGTTWIGVEGWQDAGLYAVPTQANGLAATGDFHVAHVGFYLDRYDTRLPPPFEVPEIGVAMRRCQRYFTKVYGLRGVVIAATTASRMQQQLPVPMRAAPTLTPTGAPRVYDGAATSAISAPVNVSTPTVAEANFTTAGLTAPKACSHYWTADADYVSASARL